MSTSIESNAQNARTEINEDLIFSSETVTFWHDDFLSPDPNSIQGNGVAQSVYYETIIPIPMKQIFYPDGSSNIDCSGNIFEFNVTGGFTIEPYILTGNSSNNIRSVSVSKATLVFDSQEQPLSSSPTWTRAFYDSSKFVDKEISGSLYIKVGVVYSVEPSSVELKGSYDKVCIRAILKSGQTAWINFYNDTGSVTAGDLSQQSDKITGSIDKQTETQKGIWQTIKDFFGSFFDNLINSIIHVIVPTSEEMSNLFNRLNDFFAETFGFLYYPFDFIIDAFNIFLEADSETGLTFPGFSIMGYEVWPDMTYDLTSEPVVNTIFGYVRMGTGALLAMWFVNYLRNFFDKRFGGGGS